MFNFGQQRPQVRQLGNLAGSALFLAASSTYAFAQKTSVLNAETASNGVVLLISVFIALAIIFALSYFRRRDAKRWRAFLEGKHQPLIVRAYKGSHTETYAAFQKEAGEMASHSYFPASQNWIPGQWGTGHFVVALLLCFVFFIGVLVFIYMLVVKPNGTLTVTYELRAAAAAEKTCPNCAEQIKSRALVCYFCNYEFSADDTSQSQVRRRAKPYLLNPPAPPQRHDGSSIEASCTEYASSGYDYDRARWNALVDHDDDIRRIVNGLEPYGQRYIDQFAAAFLALNDKEYLPMIVKKILESARREGIRARG